jgi:hypothetical protein
MDNRHELQLLSAIELDMAQKRRKIKDRNKDVIVLVPPYGNSTWGSF